MPSRNENQGIISNIKTCPHCTAQFVITDEDEVAHARFGFEVPDECSLCRHKQRIAFRNGRQLHWRTCDLCKKDMVSNIAGWKPYKVYCPDCWYSDRWDPLSFGRDFDFGRPFFEQFSELKCDVPMLGLTRINCENSDYCNMCGGNKNCYLVFGGDFNEETLFGTLCMHNKFAVDCDFANRNQFCYFLNDSYDCYGCRFIFDCKNCSDCAFCSDSTGCRDCILCTMLVQKQYCIRNLQFSKEEYERQKRDLVNGSYMQQQKNWSEFLALRGTRTVKYAHILNAQHCSGDYIEGSKNCRKCFDVWDSEDMFDVVLGISAKDCVDCGFVGHELERCYNLQSAIGDYECAHGFSVWNCQHAEYCDTVIQSRSIFGSTQLHQKHHCILNKEYTEQEFKNLRERIVEHMKKSDEWGRFFPRSLSTFGYNESTACDFFPMSREQALKEGFTWDDHPPEVAHAEKEINAAELSDRIDETPDDILNWAVRSEKSGRPFKIIKQELDFYRHYRIRIPQLHPDERHLLRMSLRNPRTMWKRECMKCDKEIETTYSPERTERVLCEECYLKEVY